MRNNTTIFNTDKAKSDHVPVSYLYISCTDGNRIVQLEGTYNNHLVQLPVHFRADQKLKRSIKGIVQRSLRH